jgi:hypothetical protein
MAKATLKQKEGCFARKLDLNLKKQQVKWYSGA